jgi:hypothetical protein
MSAAGSFSMKRVKVKGLRIMHTKLTGFNGMNVTLEIFPTCLTDGTCFFTI